MSCFSLAWVEQLCIWLIILFAIVAIIKALLPALGGLIPFPIVITIISIVLWAVVAIVVVEMIFMLIGCLVGGGGLRLFPR